MLDSHLMGNHLLDHTACMRDTALAPWQRALHLLYAGLFALVLPFVCWGAYAVPGHPHAHAHLVFWLPPEPLPAPGAQTLSQALASLGAASLCTGHGAPAVAATASQLPVGRAAPSLLVSVLLVLVSLFLQLLPARRDRPGFATLATALSLWSPLLPIPTPPPRLVCS